MNEILRFKKNRLIPKGLYGLKPHEVLGSRVNGEGVAYVNIPGKGYIAIDGKGNAYTYGEKQGPRGKVYFQRDSFRPINLTDYDRQHIYKAANRDNGMTGWGASVNDIARYWAAQGKPKVAAKPAAKPASAPADKPADKVTNDTPAAVVQKPAGRGVVKRTLKSQEQWDNDFQTMRNGLSSQQLMYLDSLGIDMSSAEAMQAGINKHLGNDNLAVDNKWGNKSQGALDALLRYMPEDYQNDDMKQGLANEVNLPDDAVIDAPDPFGYKTSNTYEGDDFASRMKGMGIKSNADLINFMHNSGREGWKGDAWQTQFRSDVDRALGGDYSDANIRKVFGTQGKWGRGFLGRGDFGDFQNALQTNAGVWNGMYDRKQEEARMDEGRRQYANKIAQQYVQESPLHKPLNLTPFASQAARFVGKAKDKLNKLLGSEKDFSLKGDGANTLGDAGQGSMGGNDWMKFAAQSGYLPQGMEEEEVPEDDWMQFAAQSGYLPQQ